MTDVMEAFAAVLKAEDSLSEAKAALADATNRLEPAVKQAESDLAAAWESVKACMQETGEYEVLLPGDVTDFKISWSTPRRSVKVEPDAVPDAFCKMERKPKLKEIGDYLDKLWGEGKAFPNWARFEDGVAKLTWKAVKKSA